MISPLIEGQSIYAIFAMKIRKLNVNEIWLSCVCRAVQALQGSTAPHAVADLNGLSFFLAQQNNIKDDLKNDISLVRLFF